jgi:uncharacterized membrane protein YphA (DoxX/SURF4 family)
VVASTILLAVTPGHVPDAGRVVTAIAGAIVGGIVLLLGTWPATRLHAAAAAVLTLTFLVPFWIPWRDVPPVCGPRTVICENGEEPRWEIQLAMVGAGLAASLILAVRARTRSRRINEAVSG